MHHAIDSTIRIIVHFLTHIIHDENGNSAFPPHPKPQYEKITFCLVVFASGTFAEAKSPLFATFCFGALSRGKDPEAKKIEIFASVMNPEAKK